MVNKFGISKSTMVFKTSIVKFLHKYRRMKKCALFLHFLKNNFKITKFAMKMRYYLKGEGESKECLFIYVYLISCWFAKSTSVILVRTIKSEILELN